MDEFSIVRSIALRIGERARVGGRLEKRLAQWLVDEEDWLQLGCADEALLAARLDAVRAATGATDPGEAVAPMANARQIAALLGLEGIECDLLLLAVAYERSSRVRDLAQLADAARISVGRALGFALSDAPDDATPLFRASVAARLGLLHTNCDSDGTPVDLDWRLSRLLDLPRADEAALNAALAGPARTTTLGLDAFAHVEDAPLMAAMLRGAAERGTAGIHLLIHGPPGTGKTELAKALATAAGLTLHAVGESDDDGAEPSRFERVSALAVALRIAARRPATALLFDEMEDMTDSQGSNRNRQGSKVWINRMLECSVVPILWTSNCIDEVDPALLRRMSFILKLDYPPVSAARAMIDRIAQEEGTAADPALITLAERAPATASVLRPALRAAALTGKADAGERTARSLVKALGGDPDGDCSGSLDTGLFESELPIEATLALIVASGASDVSLLLTGPPGTGKTALAHELARALDRPLLVRRTSDLLSKWVGGTEQAIAGAFAEARSRGGVLLLDEVDSLLRDRSLAASGWEVSQVNELLTWLDRHPLPVVAATNHAARIDPAAMRRFLFKIDLKPLGQARARRAFEQFFRIEPPAALDRLHGLTPGDFALVARRRRMLGGADAGVLIDELKRELAAKPDATSRIGF